MDHDASFFDALADVPNLRSSSFDDLEIKDGGNVFLFDGYSSVFGDIADLKDFTEEVRHGAFDEVLASNQNVPMLHEHDPRELLATTRSGRLKLEADGRGLRTRAKLVKTDLSSRIKALADSGDITGMSTGYIVGRDSRNQRQHTIDFSGAKPHRVITGFKKILDVSTTWNPTYVTTEAQFRSKAMEYVNDPLSWQRLLMGAYPQLEELGHDEAGSDDEPETRSEPEQHEDAHPGVSADVETAKRRLRFALLLTGDDNAS